MKKTSDDGVERSWAAKNASGYGYRAKALAATLIRSYGGSSVNTPDSGEVSTDFCTARMSRVSAITSRSAASSA